jgi:phage host-nuclease inhibitor protein Gam
MAKSKKIKSTAPTVVAQNRDEVAQLITTIGQAQRSAAALELQMNEKVSAIKAEYAPLISSAKDPIKPAQEAIAAWCTSNRADLLADDKTKTVDFFTGKVFWRLRAPALKVTGEEQVIAYLLKNRKVRFLRRSISINREALLADQEAAIKIPGVSIATDIEDFFIEPSDATA